MKKRASGSEPPPGTAFACRGRPTAEHCRRAVVMETGRKSRLFIGINKTDPLPSSSSLLLLLLHRHPARTGSQTVTDFLWPLTKAGTRQTRHGGSSLTIIFSSSSAPKSSRGTSSNRDSDGESNSRAAPCLLSSDLILCGVFYQRSCFSFVPL